jgi:hypothetical protein
MADIFREYPSLWAWLAQDSGAEDLDKFYWQEQQEKTKKPSKTKTKKSPASQQELSKVVDKMHAIQKRRGNRKGETYLKEAEKVAGGKARLGLMIRQLALSSQILGLKDTDKFKTEKLPSKRSSTYFQQFKKTLGIT